MRVFLAAAAGLIGLCALSASAQTPRPGETFRDCAECPEMVAIPAGSFLMGSPEDESGRQSDEGPQHSVSIRAFAVGKYEVTFAQWDACVSRGGCDNSGPLTAGGDHGWGPRQSAHDRSQLGGHQ